MDIIVRMCEQAEHEQMGEANSGSSLSPGI